jgi:hypothetical protein
MSRRNGTPPETQWGHVEEVAELPEITERLHSLFPRISFNATIYRWVPPRAWGEQLRGEAAFQLCCVNGENGRRFYPINKPGGYLATAFASGLAALSQILGLTAEQRFSYRALWLLFERKRSTREHLKNKLGSSTSLRVRRSGRGLEASDSLLPESVGRNGSERGETWSLRDLLNEGREEAQEQGVTSPNDADCVCHGLLRAARLNPLRLTPS